GAQTFIVMINVNTSTAPVYANTYNPGNSHIDLYAPDPYPCRTEVGGCDYSRITRALAAAEAAGIPRGSIVPVYQAFGGGNWSDDGGGQYTLPTVSQEQQILATWASVVPNPVFDYAYSWGTQNSDQALEGSTALQAVFAATVLASDTIGRDALGPRTIRLAYEARVTPPPGTERVELWLPLPREENQAVRELKLSGSGHVTVVRLPESADRVAWVRAEKPSEPVVLGVTALVTRQELRAPVSASRARVADVD